MGIQPEWDEDKYDVPLLAAGVSTTEGTTTTRLGTHCTGKYRDDITKQPLIDSLVTDARRKEMEYFSSKGVWLKVPRQQCYDVTRRPPITVRWVDVNKGDDDNPRYRSRLVARQLKVMDSSDSTYFAPSPPLEALRTVLALAQTSVGDYKPNLDPSSADRTQISTLDISRAYFNAIKDGDDVTFVELPAEDPDSGRLIGRLLRHMYGTRAAADGWQEEYSTTLVSLGFTQGRSSPCLFHHAERGLYCSVHGDDFTTVGGRLQLEWFEGAMKDRYELTIGPRLGPGPSDAKEVSILNRIVR